MTIKSVPSNLSLSRWRIPPFPHKVVDKVAAKADNSDRGELDDIASHGQYISHHCSKKEMLLLA